MRLVFLQGEAVAAAAPARFAARLPRASLVNAYSTWESTDVAYCTLAGVEARVQGQGQGQGQPL